MRMRWKSCWREYGKCSHKWLVTATPRDASSALSTRASSELQPPQEVAALVDFLSAPMVVQPASIAAQMAPLLTLLQEQICAVAGSAATPLAGGFSSDAEMATNNAVGSSGRCVPSGDIGDPLRFRLRRFLRKSVVVATALFELLFLREANGQSAQRARDDDAAEHGQRVLDRADAFDQESGGDCSDIAAGAHDACDAAQCVAIDEGHEAVSRTTEIGRAHV